MILVQPVPPTLRPLIQPPSEMASGSAPVIKMSLAMLWILESFLLPGLRQQMTHKVVLILIINASMFTSVFLLIDDFTPLPQYSDGTGTATTTFMQEMEMGGGQEKKKSELAESFC